MSGKKKALQLSREDQQILLDDAKKRIALEAFHMKRSLDGGKLMDALKHASNMTGQLRTGLLGPKHYYDLYIAAIDELRFLETYLNEEKRKGERIGKLYELVQYAGNILPRLYLLVTVGSVYIRSKEAPAKEVLKDLVEMCKGVQHPLRGLFLRNYLSEMTKDKVPDVGSEYEGAGGNISDALDFLLLNFTEMNKLWVRMQHQNTTIDRERRENERKELRLLVGKCLSRISQLDGVDNELYQTKVLPSITEQIVNCKDKIAQQYLMECVIQVFPDEFHLSTLGTILQVCSQMHEKVDIKTIVVSLMDRLASYAVRAKEEMASAVNVFEVFFEHFTKMTAQQPNMGLSSILTLQSSLLLLSLRCYPDNNEYVNKLLGLAASTLEEMETTKGITPAKANATQHIVKLLKIPIDTYKNILRILEHDNYAKLIQYLDVATQKRVTSDIAKQICESSTIIETPEQVNSLLTLLSPLVLSAPDDPEDQFDMEDFKEEQNLVASLVHLFQNKDAAIQYAMYEAAYKHFYSDKAKEGNYKRVQYSAPPLLFCAMRLAERLFAAQESPKKVFKFIHFTMKLLAGSELPELSLRMYLQSAASAGRCEFEDIAYEFFSQAFTLYEEKLDPNSKSQVGAIRLIIGSLFTMSCFETDNYERLITKTASHASKLLHLQDQCRGVTACANLFWHEGKDNYKEEKRVLECLTKALKVADKCLESSLDVQNVVLFVEVLNKCLFFFEEGVPAVTPKYLNDLINFINTKIKGVDDQLDESVEAYYNNTLRCILAKKEAGEAKYAEIEIEL